MSAPRPTTSPRCTRPRAAKQLVAVGVGERSDFSGGHGGRVAFPGTGRGLQSALAFGEDRVIGADGFDLDTFEQRPNSVKLMFQLQRTIDNMHWRIDEIEGADQPDDVRRDTALSELVVQLADIFVEATGCSICNPTYNPVTGEVSDAFVKFFRAVIPDKVALTDEALRHRIRNAIEVGDIVPKKVQRCLYPTPPVASNAIVTEQSEVTDDDQRTDRRT